MLFRGIEFELRKLPDDEAAFREVFAQKMEEALRSRRESSQLHFDEWYAEFEQNIVWPSSLTKTQQQIIPLLKLTTRSLTKHAWDAREPELALADIQQTAAQNIARKLKEEKEKVATLTAENVQLRWTIEKVLDSAAPPSGPEKTPNEARYNRDRACS
jgi:hypothetical protein